MIDLGAIRSNVQAVRTQVGPAVKVMPAVKADAFGHGAVHVSHACLDAGADMLCVATVEEATELRESGVQCKILVFGCLVPSACEQVAKIDVATTVCDLRGAEALSKAAVRADKRAEVHIKVDTGMGRIGMRPEHILDLVRSLQTLRGIDIEGLYTHLPSADEPDREFTLAQVAEMQQLKQILSDAGLQPKMLHAANSAGVLAYPESWFDAVRPGIVIYGQFPSPYLATTMQLKETLTLKTTIVFLKEVPTGTAISYSQTHRTARKSLIATMPIGYGDGYPRALSNIGEAAVKGARVPVVGRVCMDQTIIDVTDVPDVALGDEVTLYGGGYNYLDVAHIAEKIGTIPYEIFCRIGKRVPRLYVDE